ncbi:MAG TPA: hypothetical protein VFD69_17935 [Vicinamibacterales bacterium]|nr:hypothetical protein [Vicinamibacterales bacterium]
MPPRFAYWTILVDGLPTAFRAAEREELLPTFKRLQEKHPDAAMRWFSRGQLWDSPEAARAALLDARRPPGPPRGRDWRPGGEHRDPRQKFIDAKKARNQEGRKKRFERRQEGEGAAGPREPWKERPRGPNPEARRDWKERPSGPAGARPQGPRGSSDRPQGPKPEARRDWKERPSGPAGARPERPRGSSDRPQGPKPEGRREWTDRPRGPRPPGKPSGGFGSGRPAGPRPPRGPGGPPRGPRGPRGPKR